MEFWKCMEQLAHLAFLQHFSGNTRVFQGCQRVPMALLQKIRGRRSEVGGQAKA